LGESCFIQQYHDHDPGTGARDFTCGSLSYDGHDGTDFAVPTFAAMQAGTAVLAAASGVVAGIRDGMADGPPGPQIEGRECGNGVLIEHAEGWQTQYCHLRQGSISVQQGDSVAAGDPLGLIGQSGLAEFPHLHLSVRHNGTRIDPFSAETDACGPTTDAGLWADPLPYTPGGLIGIGFATEVPTFEAIKAGLTPPVLTPQSPALVLWAHVFGARAGDTLTLDIMGPKGPVHRARVDLDRTQARLFRASGKRVPTQGWPAGIYRGTVQMQRGDIDIGKMTLDIGIAR